MSRTAIYPGSFDPMTLGHVNIVERSLEVFDEVIVAVLRHPEKRAMFSVEERVEMMKKIFYMNM